MKSFKQFTANKTKRSHFDWGTPESVKAAKSMTPGQGTNESTDDLVERSPSEIAKFALGGVVFKKQYKVALDALKSVLTRKGSKQVAGQRKGSPKHSIAYYAAQIAKSYDHVDGKTLEKMLPKNFVFEEAPVTSTASIPDSTNIGPMNGKRRKKAPVTRRYIEIMGKRRKQEL
jgi:hypothetical protein|tara:strand:+ start:983 stop:1501 length:519 start_codon:yes stop_codon:yes gene_type:complete